MQNFGVTNKEHYGMLWYFLEWPIGLFTLGLYLVAFYYPPKVKREHFSVTVFIRLCVICGSYLKIRNRLRSPAPELDVLSRQSAERNLRLSRTIFVTIAVSLVFWIPAVVVYITRDLCHRCFPPPTITTVNTGSRGDVFVVRTSKPVEHL